MLFRNLLPAIILVSFHCAAQEFEKENFTRYTRLNGLSNNYISGIIQDSSGYIWVATHKGLNRFDGNNFEPIFRNSLPVHLPDNMILSMRYERPNEIICATRGGGFYMHASTGNYRHLIVPCDSSIYFWTNHMLDIVKDRYENYIISSKTGLYVFDTTGNIIRRYDHHHSADAGRIELLFGGWLHTLNNGVTIQQNGLLGSIFNPRLKIIDTLFVRRNPSLQKELTDATGDLKISWPVKNDHLMIPDHHTNSLDVVDMNGTRKTKNPMPFNVGDELGWTSRLSAIDDSTMIITSKTNGFYVIHYNRYQRSVSCDGKKYFANVFCTAVLKDRESRFWVGTADGLYKHNRKNAFFNVTDLALQSPASLNRQIRSIYADKHSIFTGLQNSGGLLIIDKQTGKIKRTIEFTPADQYDNSITDIIPLNEDTLWVCTNRGIVWLNKNNYRYGPVHVPSSLRWMETSGTTFQLRDSKNNIWIAFGKINSVVRYNVATQTFSNISSAANPLLKLTYVFSMAEDLGGNIWFAGDGLCRWNIKTEKIDTLIPYPKVSKLLLNYMLILDRDSHNNLWLSSFENEIIQFNCSTYKMHLRLKENSFLDGNTVTSSPVIGNNIWMGTDNGISAFNIYDHSVQQFTYADGLPSVSITSYRKGSYYDKPANRFYVGAGHHLYSFVPNVSLVSKSLPRLIIEKVITGDSQVVGVPDTIYLKHDQDNVTIKFNTVNFSDPEEVRFAWRTMVGADAVWNELNDQSSITLTNLNHGANPVQIKLYSVNNRWPDQSRTLCIIIHPPFWKTGWFRMTSFVLTAGFILLVYKIRIRYIRKTESEIASINQQLAEAQLSALQTQMNPHFIFNSLNGIKGMILRGEQEKASRYLSRFANMIRITLNQSRETFTTLYENLEFLENYLAMEKLRFDDSFSFTCTVDDDIDQEETLIPTLMLQPLAENAIWHGLMNKKGEKKLNIHFSMLDGVISCCIQDNGIGLRESQRRKLLTRSPHQSVGLTNLRNRIKILNEKYDTRCTVEITDLNDIDKAQSGTRVVLHFSIPINKAAI